MSAELAELTKSSFNAPFIVLWTIYVISVLFSLCLRVRLFLTCWEGTDLLALVCDI